MKHSTLINEIKVSYKRQEIINRKIVNSMDAYTIARDVMLKDECELDVKEYFYILFLNRSNSLVGYYRLSEGGLTGTVADIRIAFATALKTLCTGIILMHNHPSGNLHASEADLGLTRRFREAGKLLDIDVLDHLIITTTNYQSLADNGQM